MSLTISVAPTVDASTPALAAAKKRYTEYVEFADSALQNPGHDWSREIHQFAVEPAISQLQSDIELFATKGYRIVGHSVYYVTIASVTARTASLQTCVDNRGQDVLNSLGRSVKAGLGGKHPQDVELALIKGEWYVKSIVGNMQKSC